MTLPPIVHTETSAAPAESLWELPFFVPVRRLHLTAHGYRILIFKMSDAAWAFLRLKRSVDDADHLTA